MIRELENTSCSANLEVGIVVLLIVESVSASLEVEVLSQLVVEGTVAHLTVVDNLNTSLHIVA